MNKAYRKTIIACFIGFIVQAIIVNFAPLLFLTFNKGFGIPLKLITVLITISFLIQLCMDVLSVKFVDLSPIVEACPADNKETAMSILHSFYSWGQVAAIPWRRRNFLPAVFALMALAGDVGCSGGPALVGFLSSAFQDNLKIGMLAATVFPTALLLALLFLRKKKET